MTLVSGDIDHFQIFENVSQITVSQSGVGWLIRRIFSFGNNDDIVEHRDKNPFWISADTNKNDLE